MTTNIRRATNAKPLINDEDLPLARIFVGGRFTNSSAGRLTEIVDPCTEELIARIPEGTAADVDQAVAAAVAAKGGMGAARPQGAFRSAPRNRRSARRPHRRAGSAGVGQYREAALSGARRRRSDH